MKFICAPLLTSALLCIFPDWASAQSPATAAVPAGVQASQSAGAPVTAPADPAEPAEPESSRDVEDFADLDLSALLDASVQTASKKSEPISRAPAVIEVLTRQQLYNLGARDLYSALTFLPGIELVQSYFGYPTFIFRGQIQEIYNAKILLLINGHPSFESVNSSSYLELIPLEAIERIEVIRGPGSALYGTNAFNGVINVITRGGHEKELLTVARVEGGSFGTLAGGAGNAGHAGELAWSVFASGQNMRGYPYRIRPEQNEDCALPFAERLAPADCAGERRLDYYTNYVNAFGSLAYRGLRLQVGGLREDQQKFGIIPVLRFQGPNEYTHAFADLSYAHDWEYVSVGARLGYDHDARIWEFNKFPLPRFAESRAENSGGLARAEFTLGITPIEQVSLIQGIGYETTVFDFFEVRFTDGTAHPLSPRFDADPVASSTSWFGQITWDITERLAAVAGHRISRFKTVRLDVTLDSLGVPQQKVVEEEPITNHAPRGGLVYAPTERIAFKALYGTAFRNPNLFETGAVLNQVVGTTPNLQPETIRTFEFAVDSRPIDRVSLRANTYYSESDNLIARRSPTAAEAPIFGATSTLHDNLAGYASLGVEASIVVIVNEQWSVFSNLSAKRVTDRDTEQKIRGTAPITGNGGFSYRPLKALALHPNAQYIGPRDKAKAYTLLNAVIDYELTPWLTVSGIGNNLSNVAYVYPESLRPVIDTIPGGPGRAFYLRLLAGF